MSWRCFHFCLITRGKRKLPYSFDVAVSSSCRTKPEQQTDKLAIPSWRTWQLELSVLRKQKTRNSVDICGGKLSEILNCSAADILFVSNWSYLQNDWFLHDDCMSCWEARSETCGKSDFLFVISPHGVLHCVQHSPNNNSHHQLRTGKELSSWQPPYTHIQSYT